MKTGRYISIALLITCLAIAFWPVLQTQYFWLSAGIVAGIIGAFIFSIAENEEQ